MACSTFVVAIPTSTRPFLTDPPPLPLPLQVKAGDKLLSLMCLLKLGLVRKKVLVFVNTVDAGFK